ncbi:Myosin-binding protein [Thalictrum thalictroides]|uniref:Myosin-binding protein n=1 Tax=Thalictrum thalictroides TaxID=46969 RepID=A0A7J6WU13_THATH|nr:Myosin-binding protein [Thalictrum thalictroides]
MTNMATRTTSLGKRWRTSSGFTAVLTSAFLEWLLIFLLFVNAVFSYLVTKVARICELQEPCLLCSRLDHLLGNETPKFYMDLICGAHKIEISSLVFCRIHNKLADVHGMCEGCLCSFATEKKSNSETYRLLVGQLGTALECSHNQDTLLKDPAVNCSNKRLCSCCNKPWASRLDSHKLVDYKATTSDIAEVDIGLPASVEKNLLHDDGLNCMEKISEEVASSSFNTDSFNPLPHVEYGVLKITSDSESEVALSDDDMSSLLRGRSNLKEEIRSQSVPLDVHVVHPEYFPATLSDDLAQKELIYQVSMSEPSLLIPGGQHYTGETHNLTSSAFASVAGHGLEDLNWHQVEQQTDASLLPELISLQDIPSSSILGEVLVEELAENLNFTGSDVFEPASSTEIQELCKLQNDSMTSTGPDMGTNQVINDRSPPTTNLMDLSDAYKLVLSNTSNQASNLREQFSMKDSSKVSGDLKLWLSQISSGRGLELSLSEISPRMYGQWEDLKISDAPSPIGLHILQKRISLERNMSGFESLDGSIVSEIEGESVVDRLKRQVEYDRKSMNSLYKELEEERNASAVAANQALAMITRLQEEKATLQMEALQYLRMMEEQSEYDVDALQKANILLAEKEEEIENLEAELEISRRRLSSSTMLKMTVENSDVSCIGYNINTPCNTPREPSDGRKRMDKPYAVNGNSAEITKDSFVAFENERSYLSKCLKKLEKRLQLFSNNGVHFPNGGITGKEVNRINYLKQHDWEEVTQGNSQRQKDELPMQKDQFVSSSIQDNSSSLIDDPQVVSEEKYDSDFEGKDKENDLVALENEVSLLNERLQALESDRNFLEHTINSLRTGDGIQFVKEIAHDLQELRRIGIRRDQAIQ